MTTYQQNTIRALRRAARWRNGLSGALALAALFLVLGAENHDSTARMAYQMALGIMAMVASIALHRAADRYAEQARRVRRLLGQPWT